MKLRSRRGSALGSSDHVAASRGRRGGAPLWLRWRVRVNAFETDHQLALGCPPAHSPCHELRALQLATARERWSLARALEAIVHDARVDRGWSSKVPIRRRAVRENEEELLRLARCLTDPGCTAIRGVARASCLIADGLGPLYVPGEQTLHEAVAEAIAALRA